MHVCVFWSGSGAAVVSVSRPTGGSGILRVRRESSVRVFGAVRPLVFFALHDYRWFFCFF